MVIRKRARLLPSPFVGSRIGINLNDSLVWGIHSVQLAEGSAAFQIDWGDGTRQTCEAVSDFTHTYPAPGKYEVRVSDDIKTFNMHWNDAVMRLAVTSFATNAKNLTTLTAYAFADCANLSVLDISRDAALSSLILRAFRNCVSLPSEVRLYTLKSLTSNSFEGCPQITALRFLKANEDVIREKPGFETAFGAENATVYFDP